MLFLGYQENYSTINIQKINRLLYAMFNNNCHAGNLKDFCYLREEAEKEYSNFRTKQPD